MAFEFPTMWYSSSPSWENWKELGTICLRVAEWKRRGARYSLSTPDGYVYWQDHYNRFGKIPFLIHPDILTSDEAIIAVIQHEMSELAGLRQVFFSSRRRRMNATDYGLQVATGSVGNFHDQAWDAADAAVL